ncbi:hypothetical protein [Methanoregula sp.]|nr:hypothetical protein [Methanoregula sp.]MDD5143550.1 hypothetical protein [Methanoregula sp.]
MDLLSCKRDELCLDRVAFALFEKAGWLPVVSFDCLIDANIDPVEVTINK